MQKLNNDEIEEKILFMNSNSLIINIINLIKIIIYLIFIFYDLLIFKIYGLKIL